MNRHSCGRAAWNTSNDKQDDAQHITLCLLKKKKNPFIIKLPNSLSLLMLAVPSTTPKHHLSPSFLISPAAHKPLCGLSDWELCCPEQMLSTCVLSGHWDALRMDEGLNSHRISPLYVLYKFLSSHCIPSILVIFFILLPTLLKLINGLHSYWPGKIWALGSLLVGRLQTEEMKWLISQFLKEAGKNT